MMTNGGVLILCFAHHDFERVLQAGIGQRGKFGEILFEIGEAEDVAQAEPHQFRLVIPAQPEKLVGIVEAVAQIFQNFRRGSCAGAGGRRT